MSVCGARETKRESGVAGVLMRDVSHLVCHHGAADAGMLRPSAHPGLEEGAVDDQLTATVEEVEEGRLALRPLELVLLSYR
jgi:hypothetical protein